MYLYINMLGIMMVGVLFDMAVVYYAKDLNLFDDDKTESEPVTEAADDLADSLTLPQKIDALKASSQYNIVYGSHASLSKDSSFQGISPAMFQK